MSKQNFDHELWKRSFLNYVFTATKLPFELEYKFALPERQWRSDVAWVDQKVALEIDGGTWVSGRHNRPSTSLNEMDKNNGYASRGWLVFHAPWAWVKDVDFAGQIITALWRRQALRKKWLDLNRENPVEIVF